MGRETLERDQRHRVGRGFAQRPGRQQLVGKSLAEEQPSGDDVVDLPEPKQGQVAQAGSHRRADQQGTGEHRHRDPDTGDDGEVGAPEVGQAASQQCA